MTKAVGVFCASSQKMDPFFYQQAEQVGHLLATLRLDLVYGGGRVGMMGATAQAVHASGGRVVGVIPEMLMAREVAYREADELIVTEGMMQRKQVMIDRSDAFLVLPGGYGTLDEALEVITLRQLGINDKAVIFLNSRGYFDGFFAFAEQMRQANGIATGDEALYGVVSDVAGLVPILGNLDNDR